MAENPLTKLPLVGQLGISLGLAAAIGGAFWYFYWTGAQEEEAKKKAALSKLTDEIRALEVYSNKKSEFLREVEQRQAKLDVLKRILPGDKETPELMKKVQYLATQSNLNIKRFNPGPTVSRSFEAPEAGAKPGGRGKPAPGAPPAAQDTYQEWPINVDLEGTYHNLGLFLDRVSRLSRLVNVGGLKIKSQSNQKPSKTILVSAVATTFVYVEAPPGAGSSAAGAKPGAAKR